MNNALLPLLALLALSSPGLAHFPPGPDETCGPSALHDYGPGVPGVPLVAIDGCADGDAEWGARYASLPVENGDGAGGGYAACDPRGLPTAHHGTTIFARDDIVGFGPAFSVVADHSATPPASGPDCGDNILQPCPPPHTANWPHPYDVIIETAYGAVNDANALACNPRDRHMTFGSDPAVSGGPVRFPPGADGTYLVFIESAEAVAGHVWTA